MPRAVRGDGWRPRMDSHHQPPDSKSGALLVELQGYDPPTGVAPVSRRYQRRASLPTLWRNLKWSGTSVLPRVSRRSERRGLLSSSCPDTLCPSKWWSHGESHPDLRNAIASSCYWTMAPKWTRAPDSHRVIRFCRPMVRRLCLARGIMAFEDGGSRRACSPFAHGERSVFETVPARLSGSASILKLVSRHGAAPCSAV